jgi:stearoyl-CoA desaturase (delta-9 desaturase)
MFLKIITAWFDNHSHAGHEHDPERIEFLRIVPFILLHLCCLAVFWIEFSNTALIVAISLYLLRMFAITGFYHRYFAHKAFKTSRATQFVFAYLACYCSTTRPFMVGFSPQRSPCAFRQS